MNMQVLDARRDLSGGYKVDVTRGERDGRVSSEWFSRPDDPANRRPATRLRRCLRISFRAPSPRKTRTRNPLRRPPRPRAGSWSR